MMPLQSIIIVILRLLALQWIAGAILNIPSWFMLSAVTPKVGLHIVWLCSIQFVVTCIVFAACWIWAPKIAQLLVTRFDAPVNLSGLTAFHLYNFIFLWFGLSNGLSGLRGIAADLPEAVGALSHAANLNFTLINKSVAHMAGSIVSLAISFMVIVFAAKWAKRLASHSE
jgi:hypothetical protein